MISNLLTIVSLILCLTAIGFWVRGYFAEFGDWSCFMGSPYSTEYFFSRERGGFAIGQTVRLDIPPEALTMQWVRSRPFTQFKFGAFGFYWGEDVPYVDLASEGRPSFVHDYVRLRALCPRMVCRRRFCVTTGVVGATPVA